MTKPCKKDRNSVKIFKGDQAFRTTKLGVRANAEQGVRANAELGVRANAPSWESEQTNERTNERTN